MKLAACTTPYPSLDVVGRQLIYKRRRVRLGGGGWGVHGNNGRKDPLARLALLPAGHGDSVGAPMEKIASVRVAGLNYPFGSDLSMQGPIACLNGSNSNLIYALYILRSVRFASAVKCATCCRGQRVNDLFF